jgi:hypothetical protein
MHVADLVSVLSQHPVWSSYTFLSSLALARRYASALRNAFLGFLAGCNELYEGFWDSLVRFHATHCRGVARLAENRVAHRLPKAPSASAPKLRASSVGAGRAPS